MRAVRSLYFRRWVMNFDGQRCDLFNIIFTCLPMRAHNCQLQQPQGVITQSSSWDNHLGVAVNLIYFIFTTVAEIKQRKPDMLVFLGDIVCFGFNVWSVELYWSCVPALAPPAGRESTRMFMTVDTKFSVNSSTKLPFNPSADWDGFPDSCYWCVAWSDTVPSCNHGNRNVWGLSRCWCVKLLSWNLCCLSLFESPNPAGYQLFIGCMYCVTIIRYHVFIFYYIWDLGVEVRALRWLFARRSRWQQQIAGEQLESP